MFAFLLLYTGCSDSITDPYESGIITVEGRLLNEYLLPIHSKWIKIGDTQVLTDFEGKFHFPDVSIPYDISVLDSARSFLYKNVSLRNPMIRLFTQNQIFSTTTVKVNLPATNSYRGKAVVTNYNDINLYGDLSSTGGTISLQLINENERLVDVIVLLYETDSEDHITDYKNFSKKRLVVKPRLTYNVNLTEQDLNYKPETEIISGSNISQYSNNSFYVSFSPKRPVGYNYKFDTQRDIFSFVVPKKLPVDFGIVVGSDFQFGWSFNLIKDFPKNLLLTAIKKPDLMIPEDNAIGIDKNSLITFSNGDGHGVFLVEFYRQNRYFTVVTKSNEVYFGDLEKLDYDYSPSHSTSWSVRKEGEFYSINEYLAIPGLNHFHSYTLGRTFTASGN
jgi:hypothetical protein